MRRSWPQLPVIVIASSPDLMDISRWLAAGATDYVTLPITPSSLIPRVLRAAAEQPSDDAAPEIEGFVGRGPGFTRVLQNIRAVARCDATVLIEGETGTGKELCARAIHRLSARHSKPLNTINCGAIPRDLIENELFGHQKAAFTGASAAQLGLIAASEGGSLFFDEVDAFGQSEQVTLLRFVQNQEYRPLGGTRVLRADVRVMAATNSNLSTRVKQGHFREDLFYRLDMLRVCMPPLRERREDIPLLARYALATYAKKFQARGRTFDDDAIEALAAHDWPGNVRQLEHVVGRAVAFAFHDDVITRQHLKLSEDEAPQALAVSLREGKRRIVADFERSRVCACLAAHSGNIARAAQAAGKNRRAFFELMRKYSVRAEEFLAPPGASRGRREP
ncbi:MAG: sigma-54-dependent Fis family transcriptional regulator [Acidobacteria bacterium]|nr:sigma-54-dependent Fis family transcriptional regulator [Acidobacteriota bacterium]